MVWYKKCKIESEFLFERERNDQRHSETVSRRINWSERPGIVKLIVYKISKTKIRNDEHVFEEILKSTIS
jgi:hypothetical protein